MNIKRISAFLLVLALSTSAFAQKVWIDRAKGGSSGEQQYFNTNIPEAVKRNNYRVVTSRENSDIYITITVEPNIVTVGLYDNQTKEQIATNAMGYITVDDMNKWNSYLINELMADGNMLPSGGSANAASGVAPIQFSGGARAGYAALNPVTAGVGSYLMGDVSGGLFVTTAYGFAANLMLWDIVGLDYTDKDDYKYQIAGIPGLLGIGIGSTAAIFSIVRPLVYQKSAFANGDFSFGFRFGMAALNPLLGMGSYIMGDWLGGMIMTIGYGTALGLFIEEISGLNYTSKDDVDYDKAGIPGLLGLGVAGATVLFGFIRPFFYQRTASASNRRTAQALKGMNIALLPDKSGMAVRVGYTYRY